MDIQHDNVMSRREISVKYSQPFHKRMNTIRYSTTQLPNGVARKLDANTPVQ